MRVGDGTDQEEQKSPDLINHVLIPSSNFEQQRNEIPKHFFMVISAEENCCLGLSVVFLTSLTFAWGLEETGRPLCAHAMSAITGP